MTKLTIGFTKTPELIGHGTYVPMLDGYREGAEQTTATVEIDGPDLSTEEWAEAVFVATNAPSESDCDPYPGALEIRKALYGQRFRSLSVGDTVEIDGLVRLSCEGSGWKEITN